MLITPLASVAPTTPIAPAHAAPIAPTSRGSQPVSAVGAVDPARDGVTQLSTPIIDFPGVVPGDRYTLANGSKAGKFGSVKGDATILRFDDAGASFHVKAGKFGLNVDVKVDVERIDAERVRIHTYNAGIDVPDSEFIGRIVASRRDYAEFVREDDATQRMVVKRDAKGIIVIDATVPSIGDAHLILEPKR